MLRRFLNFFIAFAPEDGAGGGGTPQGDAQASSTPPAGPVDGQAQPDGDKPTDQGEAPEDGAQEDLSLSKNRLAELARKDAYRRGLAEKRKSSDKAADPSAEEDADDDDDDDLSTDVGEKGAKIIRDLKKQNAKLEGYVTKLSGRFEEMDSNALEAEDTAAAEEVVNEFRDGMFEVADKVFKGLPADHKNDLHEVLELISDAEFDKAQAAGREFDAKLANEVLKTTIARTRKLFGSLGEVVLRDAAETKDKHKITPGSGTSGEEAPKNLLNMTPQQRRSAAQAAAEAAEKARPPS